MHIRAIPRGVRQVARAAGDSISPPPIGPSLSRPAVLRRSPRLTSGDERLARYRAIAQRIVQVPGEDPAYLTNYLRKFSPLKTPRLEIPRPRLDHPYATVRPEDFMVVQPLGSGSATSIAIMSDRDDGKPLGYAIQTFSPGSTFLDYMVVDITNPRAKGVADAFFAQDSALQAELQTTESRLEAAWVGRYRWALDGYDFDSTEQLTDLRQRFAGFMAHHGLDSAELVFDRGDGTIEPFSADRLNHAWDFAHVRSLVRSVKAKLRTGDESTSVVRTDVGKAFMMGDVEDPDFEAITAPSWWGVRSHDPESPSAKQHKRYAAIRAARRTP